MKLKYYLRGLGIGILVTVFLVARLQGGSTAPDATEQELAEETQYLQELEQPEKEEGFLDNTEILQEMEAAEEPVQEAEEEQPAVEEEVAEEETAALEETEPVEEIAAEEEKPADDTKPETIESAEQFAIIPIYSGEGSETVARRLQDSGVVSSATAFDKFLCQQGYDRKLVVGQHEVPFAATEEEIAQILCKR
ncbi:MAG: hypothetical protein MJ134_04820 [Lachnospiraceae bacterium]|nr:hypothetical protein [Lachnospiraceae bacterium]